MPPGRKCSARDTQPPLWDGEVPGFGLAIGQQAFDHFSLAPGDGKRGCVIVMAGGSYTSKAVHEESGGRRSMALEPRRRVSTTVMSFTRYRLLTMQNGR